MIGRVTGTGRYRILEQPDGPDAPADNVLADLPAASLSDDAPRYERPVGPSLTRPAVPAPPVDAEAALLGLLVDTVWVSSQYDSQLFLSTVEGPGGDAAVLRLKHPTTGFDTGRGLALTTDGNHRWCAIDPRVGGLMTMCESVLNLACVGAWPLAMVNCLNFGNPEHPEVMRQLTDVIEGLSVACEAFGVPVVGGNVSLYNESRGSDIDPTPVIGVLGVVDHLDRRPPGVALLDGGHLLLIGPRAEQLGLPADVDLQAVSAVAGVVRSSVLDGLVAGVHDVSDGGLAASLGELVARSGVGAAVEGLSGAEELFSEWPGRVVACVPPATVDEVLARCIAAGVTVSEIGVAGGDRLTVAGLVDLPVADVVGAYRDALPNAMAAGASH